MKKAEIGPRIGALIIDILISIPLGMVALIPFIGILAGLLAVAYWLCRDLVRPSLGKKALNLDVVDINGGRPTDQQLILRNVPFAVPSLISMIPFLGVIAGPALATVVFVLELVMFITQGQRFGDKIANTQVIART